MLMLGVWKELKNKETVNLCGFLTGIVKLGPLCPVNSTLGKHLDRLPEIQKIYSKDSHPTVFF